MQAVYDDWADAMQGLTLGAINHGIELSKSERNPPNQGEFVDHCRKYRPEGVLKLSHRLTPEELERNRERIAKIAVEFALRKSA